MTNREFLEREIASAEFDIRWHTDKVELAEFRYSLAQTALKNLKTQGQATEKEIDNAQSTRIPDEETNLHSTS